MSKLVIILRQTRMVKKVSLTVEEKILLHLLEYLKFRDQNWDVPFDVTQEGIASSVSSYEKDPRKRIDRRTRGSCKRLRTAA